MSPKKYNCSLTTRDGRASREGILEEKKVCPNWASEASPTLGCSIEISRDIYMSVGRYVCRGPKSVGGITWAKRAHAQSQFWAVKSDPYYSFRLYARAALTWTEEKRSLRNEKLKANRAS